MTYTEKDFRRARFAEHRWGGLARRLGSGWSVETRGGDDDRASDAWMVQNSWIPIYEAAPLSLDTLREAWENAEVPTGDNPARVGDTVIGPLPYGGYEVYEKTTKVQFPHQRIFKRAPREPWADLKDELDTYGIGVSRSLAEELHRAGWRKTGGDDE